ncbi:hypothetical protein DFP72DRAFT_1076940 [Ephemerocybe angulata]|uniref:Uncharacterized protein n=1 Tax=Ephemerocybe angulata TaxID=980116 RepID=A0A8H6HGE7_9AGAR|nr:hypothetical protein DFP72DRAFT_1076940 [Tulosesus angulatus]
MLFKFVTILAAVATAVSASAVDLEARQVGGLATCNIVTTPSSTPNGGSLSEEFILVFNREFSNDLPPGNSIVTGSTSFTGPSGGRYTVQKTTGGTAITAAQTRAIMQAWAGQTFAGAGQVGVSSWSVNSSSVGPFNLETPAPHSPRFDFVNVQQTPNTSLQRKENSLTACYPNSLEALPYQASAVVHVFYLMDRKYDPSNGGLTPTFIAQNCTGLPLVIYGGEYEGKVFGITSDLKLNAPIRGAPSIPLRLIPSPKDGPPSRLPSIRPIQKTPTHTNRIDYPEALPTRTLTTATSFHFRRFTATWDLDRHIPLSLPEPHGLHLLLKPPPKAPSQLLVPRDMICCAVPGPRDKVLHQGKVVAPIHSHLVSIAILVVLVLPSAARIRVPQGVERHREPTIPPPAFPFQYRARQGGRVPGSSCGPTVHRTTRLGVAVEHSFVANRPHLHVVLPNTLHPSIRFHISIAWNIRYTDFRHHHMLADPSPSLLYQIEVQPWVPSFFILETSIGRSVGRAV